MYLLFGGITGTFSPYLHVFLESLGFRSDHAGFLTGIRFILSSLANPVWGYFADRTGNRKLVLFLLCAGSAVLVFPQPWIARSLRHSDVPTNQTHTANATTVHIKEFYGSTNEMTGFNMVSSHGNKGYNDVLYYVMLGVSSLSAIFVIPLPGYLDTVAVNVINGPHGRGATYGGQRIFGDVGFRYLSFVPNFSLILCQSKIPPGVIQYC